MEVLCKCLTGREETASPYPIDSSQSDGDWVGWTAGLDSVPLEGLDPVEGVLLLATDGMGPTVADTNSFQRRN